MTSTLLNKNSFLLQVKLDLMDDSSQLVRALNLIYFDSVDYNSLFDESLSNRAKRRILRIATDKIDTFIMEWVVKGVLAELDDIINPVDRGLLKRLVTRLQQHINVPWARFDQRSPAELAEEFLFMLPPVLSDLGLTKKEIETTELGFS